MAHISESNVRETSETEGTGNIVLEGAMFGSLSLADVMSAGDTCDYAVWYGSVFEEGIGTRNAAGELERTYITRAKHANGTIDKNVVSLPAGVKAVIIGVNARRFIETVNVAGGTANALTLTTGRSLPALFNGQRATFVAAATNTDATTIDVDGLGLKPLRSAPGEALVPGVIISGTPYTIVYRSSGDQWLLEGSFGDPYSIPIGGMLEYGGTAVPNSRFVLPYGQALSRTIYATLFDRFGTTYGSGDSSTTFNVPDLRGRYVATWDAAGGVSASRITSSVSGFDAGTIGTSGGAQSYNISQTHLPASVSIGVTITASISGTYSKAEVGATQPNVQIGPGGATLPSSLVHNTDSLVTNPSYTGSISSLGSGTALQTLPPTIVLNKILRVL